MKPDISSKEDINFIITKFYDKLIADVEMKPFFEEFIQQNTLEHHLEIITSFWNDILFDTTSYKNNTMQKHLDFSKKIPFTKEHFSRWTSYFFATIDNHFNGLNAEKMKNRANSIAMVMQLKIGLYDS